MPAVSLSFSEFLAKYSHLQEEPQKRLVSLVEEQMADLLRQWVLPEFTDVWDITYDHNFYEWARNSVLSNQTCKETLGEDAFNLFSQALKQVASYLGWKKQKACLGSTGKKRGKKQVSAPLPPIKQLTEGELAEMHVVKRERNQVARAQCIAHFRQLHDGRILCECCGVDFGEIYGDLGEGFIEVHHLNPISQQDEAHSIDPTTDLVPLCPNCHAMIHRLLAREKCEGVESLKHLQGKIGK